MPAAAAEEGTRGAYLGKRGEFQFTSRPFLMPLVKARGQTWSSSSCVALTDVVFLLKLTDLYSHTRGINFRSPRVEATRLSQRLIAAVVVMMCHFRAKWQQLTTFCFLAWARPESGLHCLVRATFDRQRTARVVSHTGPPGVRDSMGLSEKGLGFRVDD